MLISSSELLSQLQRDLAACAYPGYVYGYPHKKAYRTLPALRSLEEVWADEDRRALFCYVHLPFCNQRCSFCNLFTYVPHDSPAPDYLAALRVEMAASARALGSGANFARLYLGGGTPTYLTTAELGALVGLLRSELGVRPERTHGCLEASPETLDEEKVEALRELGFQRLSLGVQSFVPAELRHVNRKFDFTVHDRALSAISRAGFPHFNIDLIYGLPGQTPASWRHSLQRAIDSSATSLFLYPLYVRPLTGLDRRRDITAPTTHEMAALYDDALDLLNRIGFRQVTMRQFRRDPLVENGATTDLEYSCQRNGMVGLGAGARSYTTTLHYSTPWRMVARNIKGVVDDYAQRLSTGDTSVTHGFVLNEEERQRRFVIQSLLYDGLDREEFGREFGADPRTCFPDAWEALAAEGLIAEQAGKVALTPQGVRHADVVGQLFFSARVRHLMATYEYDA